MLAAADKIETVANDLVEPSVAVVEVHDLAVHVRASDLLGAPLLELQDGGVADDGAHHVAHGLVLVHDLFECFLIFHTFII